MRRNPNGTAAAKKWTRERAHGTGPPADATRMDLMPNTKPAASIFGEESYGSEKPDGKDLHRKVPGSGFKVADY